MTQTHSRIFGIGIGTGVVSSTIAAVVAALTTTTLSYWLWVLPLVWIVIFCAFRIIDWIVE